MGQNPGRPAYPRPAGLAPLQTLPHLQSWGIVMNSSVSVPRIGCRFDRMDRKACTRIKGPTIQCKDMSMSSIHLHGRSQASTRNVGAMEGRGEPEGGRPASTRLTGLARAGVEATQLSPTPGEHLRHPGEDGALMATSPGRPALGRPVGPTLQPLKPRLRVEAKHNCHNRLQPTPRALPAQNRLWKAINRSLIPHL